MKQNSINGLVQAGVLKFRKGVATVGAAGTVALATVTPALAQSAPDVSDAVASFDAAATAIGLIGVAMVAAAGAGIVYRWVTAFMVK